MAASKIALGFVFALGLVHINAIENSLFAESNPCKDVPTGKTIANRQVSCRAWRYCENNAVASSGKCADDHYFDLRNASCMVGSHADCKFCKNVGDGIFVKDPVSCKNYYYCHSEKGTLGSCPDGFYFDEDKQLCGNEDNVKCLVKPTPQDPWCRDIPDEVSIAYPGDCQKYVVCKSQRATVKQCRAGFWYNKMTGRCDYAFNVKCNRCLGKEDGYFLADLDDNTCRGYYYCKSQEISSKGKCDEDHIFEEENQQCADKRPCTIDPCQGKPDNHRMQDRTDCKKYMICKNGRTASTVTCKDEMNFNEKTQMCNDPSSFKCL